MSGFLRRLEHGERPLAAEVGIRVAGALLVMICAALMAWVYRAMHRPSDALYAAAFVAAMLGVACWSIGWALLAEGPGLFRLMPVPPRPIYNRIR